MLKRSDDDWPVVLHNIRKTRKVWGRLGELLWREWADPTASEKNFHSVVQEVLLFEAETWVLTETIIWRLEGAQVSVLRQVMRKKATRRRYGSWRQVPAEAVLHVAGKHTLRIYVARIQATVAEWENTRTIFDVYARYMAYEGGGRLRLPWWRQKAADNQLRVTAEAMFVAATVRW